MSIYYPSDKNGNEIPFRTPTEYIYDDNFVTLATKLSSYSNSINGKETEIVGAIPTSIVFSNNSLSMKNSSNAVITSINIISSTYPPANVSNVSINKRGDTLVIYWTDPNNSYADSGQSVPIALWKGTRVVVKKDSAPAHPNDGDIIINSIVKNQYTSLNPLIVDELELGETYYIRFFPYNEDDIFNADTSMIYNIKLSVDTVYGFHIDYSDSNPSTAITYLEDAIGKTPVHMDFNTGVFDWGDWDDDDFFIPRPCLLNYDGTVAYYLDPDDYSKKADGTSSNISSSSVNGNFMMEWGRGGDKIWYKVVPDSSSSGKGVDIYFSNTQMDSDYHCWNFYDASNTVRDHFYTPIYNGTYISSRIRSISGQTPSGSQTVETEISYAQSNNTAGELSGNRWFIETYGDKMLINWLLVLLGKSLDTQTVYGHGYTVATQGSTTFMDTGTMDTRGLFFGDSSGATGVKVFGMEHYWANMYRDIVGVLTYNGYQYVKLTPNTADGSTASAYSATSVSGMINTNVTASNTNTYSRWYKYNSLGYGVVFQDSQSGSNTTYYSDKGYTSNSTSTVYHAGVCGDWVWSDDKVVGAFFINIKFSSTNAYSYVNASLSYR